MNCSKCPIETECKELQNLLANQLLKIRCPLLTLANEAYSLAINWGKIRQGMPEEVKE